MLAPSREYAAANNPHADVLEVNQSPKGQNTNFIQLIMKKTCWFHGSSCKGFSIVFLLPDWLKLNHLKSRMECGFSDIFSAIFVSP